MTKSADQEHASPSSSFPAYVFEGPAQIASSIFNNSDVTQLGSSLSAYPAHRQSVA